MSEKEQDKIKTALSDDELNQVAGGFSEEAGWTRTNLVCKYLNCDGTIWRKSTHADGIKVKVYMCDRCNSFEYKT